MPWVGKTRERTKTMLSDDYLARMEQELLEEQLWESCVIIPFPEWELDWAA